MTVATVVAIAFAGIAGPGWALASTPSEVATVSSAVGTNVGIDVSFPQCSNAATPTKQNKYGTAHMPYPSGTPFAIAGVNHGIASTFNTCFVSEYNDAQTLSGTAAEPKSSVYINTGNPGSTAAWWPSSNATQKHPTVTISNPKGKCTGKSGAACAYVYGYSMAQADVETVQGYQGLNEISVFPTMWWLDVETTNSWSATDKTANASSILGMVSYLKSQSIAVGVYSTAYQWNRIAGITQASSSIAGIPSWLAGTSPSTAPKDCLKAGLTPGSHVWMLQYVYTFDEDYACKSFAAAATVSPSAASLVGTKLAAAHGTWARGTVTYYYQWLRNGAVISGATKSTHTTTSSDRGKTLSVKISAKAVGYRTSAVISAGVSILGEITPKKVTISGKLVVGQTVTVLRGTWAPSGVGYTYAWYDGTTLIPGATAKTYTLAAGDLGQKLSVIVTGSKTGYKTVTEQASSTSLVTAAP